MLRLVFFFSGKKNDFYFLSKNGDLKVNPPMRFLILWIVLLRLNIAQAFSVDFSPLTVSLQPGSLFLCANCQEALVMEQNGKKKLVCRLFGTTDVVWGTVEYKPCAGVRRTESMCGPEGRYFFRRLPMEITPDQIEKGSAPTSIPSRRGG